MGHQRCTFNGHGGGAALPRHAASEGDCDVFLRIAESKLSGQSLICCVAKLIHSFVIQLALNSFLDSFLAYGLML